MATMQKLKPCPKCGETDLPIYKYEHGWQHVECDKCQYLGPGAGSRIDAARQHNAGYEAAKASHNPVSEGSAVLSMDGPDRTECDQPSGGSTKIGIVPRDPRHHAELDATHRKHPDGSYFK